MKKYTEQEVEKMAQSARVICEASDGKVSDYAYDLTKKVISGEMTGDEAEQLIDEHYKQLGYIK